MVGFKYYGLPLHAWGVILASSAPVLDQHPFPLIMKALILWLFVFFYQPNLRRFFSFSFFIGSHIEPVDIGSNLCWTRSSKYLRFFLEKTQEILFWRKSIRLVTWYRCPYNSHEIGVKRLSWKSYLPEILHCYGQGKLPRDWHVQKRFMSKSHWPKHFSGPDWGEKFVRVTKKTWVVAYMKPDESYPVINCSRELGESYITS